MGGRPSSSTSMPTEARPTTAAARRTSPSTGPTATSVEVWTPTLVSSPAPLVAPTSSCSTSPPTTTRRPCFHQEERRGDRLHLRPEPQGQPQEQHGWSEHHHGCQERRRDRCVRLHRHLAGGLPHEPLHPLGGAPAEAEPGGG